MIGWPYNMAKNIDQEVNLEKDAILKIQNSIPLEEEKTLKFWKDNKVFEQTILKDAPKGDFVFYEGPPTANGRPGIHHLESRAFKDLFPRYKTMQGYRVLRKAGWDTHGLPVELEVEKQIGVSSKKEIEKYGIARFNEECKKSVWKYVDEWERFTERIGYWVDLKNPYITYTAPYIESVWNIVSHVEKKDLLYKDYKVVPWCPRCGTALSSHELAQGYALVKDLSVYVLLESFDNDEYFSAWTTTPWTLPGNVALAVGENIEYSLIVIEGKKIWMAKDRAEVLFADAEIIKSSLGRDLIGRKYKPLYPFLKELLPKDQEGKVEKAWKIYPAKFVTTEDGTGIVHTAVMYGQDDFELGTEVGLPKFHLVDETGHFIPGTGVFSGRFVKDEEVAIDVIKDLAHRGILLKKEKYEHSYPFCWRCKTPLIYYARDSWYIKMSLLRDELVKENQSINWEPLYTRDGRFGEWLREVKDWAISRERYWGTPLPLWVSEDGAREVISSIDELKSKTKTRRNHFIFIRHGESEHNALNIISADEKDNFHLTSKGKEESEQIAEFLSKKKVDALFTSPFFRTKQTAEIIGNKLGIALSEIIVDGRLREYNFGDYNGAPFSSFLEYEESHISSYDTPVVGGESYLDAKKRFGDFLYDIDSRYENSTIVVVTHGIGLEVIEAVVEGADMKRSKELIDKASFPPGSIFQFDFIPLPHNSLYELDLHRPYIDEIVLHDGKGKEFRRVREVLDVWFDSGAMPFAQHHYPFENKTWVDGKGFPADFICEAIDQTRGWFYTLHAIGALLGKGKAFKNVICLGHILDKEGQKMSKSRGNTVNPWEKIDYYGADVLRFWMYSVNQPGESKNFDERSVEDIVKKVFNLLLNTLSFYELYKGSQVEGPIEESKHPLDRWIVISLRQLITDVTLALDTYKALEATRALRDFIGDLSQWYVRRSRDRFKGEDREDSSHAVKTLRYVLQEISKLLAPMTPFLAEYVYQRVTPTLLSVHLEPWPTVQKLSLEDEAELSLMKDLRLLVSDVLEERAKQNIKIRQPLRLVTIKDDRFRDKKDLVQVLLDEVNVKDATFDGDIPSPILLDTTIDESLEKEGEMREFVRALQELRKKQELVPSDEVVIRVTVSQFGKEVLSLFGNEIKRICNAREIIITNEEGTESFSSATLEKV